jgi:hypothetical protein
MKNEAWPRPPCSVGYPVPVVRCPVVSGRSRWGAGASAAKDRNPPMHGLRRRRTGRTTGVVDDGYRRAIIRGVKRRSIVQASACTAGAAVAGNAFIGKGAMEWFRGPLAVAAAYFPGRWCVLLRKHRLRAGAKHRPSRRQEHRMERGGARRQRGMEWGLLRSPKRSCRLRRYVHLPCSPGGAAAVGGGGSTLAARLGPVHRVRPHVRPAVDLPALAAQSARPARASPRFHRGQHRALTPMSSAGAIRGAGKARRPGPGASLRSSR